MHGTRIARRVRARAPRQIDLEELTPPPAPFVALKKRSAELVMFDPPWPTKRRSPKGEGKSFVQHYGAMTFEQIAALPVPELMADDCLMIMWVPWGLVLHGGDPLKHYAGADAGRSLPGEIIHRYGLRFVTGGVWVKRTVTGKLVMGCGYRVRDACEPFLIAVKGAPLSSRSERNVIDGLRREHSRKPDEAFAWCERYMPGARKLELFSRQTRPGWSTWGFERGKFDPVVKLAEAA